jgi:hypothetical protein
MKFWEEFSRKTTELTNNFSTIVSKTIQNYYKLNESFSHASEYESKLKTMKHTCFDLINMYSRMNMICFLRNYICANNNTSFNKKLQEISTNSKNKYYLDISVIISFLDVSIAKYDETSLNAAYLNYKDSVKMLTPSITIDDIKKICNNIFTEDDEQIKMSFALDLKKKEFDFIKEHFKTIEFDVLFNDKNINDIKIVAYKDVSLIVAIENGINWYLCNNRKIINNEFPILLGDEYNLVIEEKYKINICCIKNEPGQGLVKTKQTKQRNYENTLFIFWNFDGKFYNILYKNKVALLSSNNNPFDNITTIQKGGSQREQIESIMNQPVLNNLLETSYEKNKIKQLNTLAYFVPIKLELYEGTEIPLNKKVALNCEDNYNNILKSWKLLFPNNDKEEKKSHRYQQIEPYSF